MATPRTEVTFHFIKSQTYATYHVDGAYGGLTPRGLVSVALYNERFPIPKTQTFCHHEGRPIGGDTDGRR